MKIVLTSHGEFCDGLLESYQMIAGMNENIYSVSLTDEGIDDFRQRLTQLLSELIENHKIILLCDIKGGTPFNESLGFALSHPKSIRIISGMNLPMVIEGGLGLTTSPDIDSLASLMTEAGKIAVELEGVHDDNFDDDLGL